MLRPIAAVIATATLLGASARADSVQGNGEFYPPTCGEPCEGLHVFGAWATSGPNGENATGSVNWRCVGPLQGGTVTTLCVSGNTAIMLGHGSPYGDSPFPYFAAIVQDNAGLGVPDFMGITSSFTPFTSCDEVPGWEDGASLTSGDFVVVDTSPLTPAQQLDLDVPCEGPKGTTAAWKNHGQYMRAVAQSVNAMIVGEIVTEDAADALVSERAASACGH